MRALKTETGFHQSDEFVKETVILVLLDQFLQLFRVDNQIETANLSETELSLVDTCLVDMLPDPVVSNALGSSTLWNWLCGHNRQHFGIRRYGPKSMPIEPSWRYW